jgi:predicted Zn-dependent protease
MRIALASSTIACSLMTLAAGCAINPVSGRPQFVLVSEQREKEMGAQEAKHIEQEMGFVDNAALAAYVDAIGQRLVAYSPRQDVQYRFHVVDMPEPNAFALPGGYVYVTRGLLVLVNSEDELAGVIGHEIGHVAARHTVQQITREAPFAVVTSLSAAVTSLASPLLGQVVGGVTGLASGFVLAPFSRDQEREADRVGQQLAAAAGWDPGAMAKFLETLQREEELEGNAPGRSSFLATHPTTPERVANTAAYAKQLKRAPSDPICATRASLLGRLDGLVVGQGASQGVFAGQNFMQPDLDFFVSFPPEWSAQKGRSQVGALSPDKHALILLEIVADGDDPLAGARALERASGSRVVQNAKPATVGSLKAARVRARTRTDSGEVALEFAWIAYGGHVYQILGVTSIQRGEAFQPVFEGVVQSFRPLQATERAGIREERLRIIEAHRDEALPALISRSKGRWSAGMTAVVNELSAAEPLAAGLPVKVAVAEPYSTPAR